MMENIYFNIFFIGFPISIFFMGLFIYSTWLFKKDKKKLAQKNIFLALIVGGLGFLLFSIFNVFFEKKFFLDSLNHSLVGFVVLAGYTMLFTSMYYEIIKPMFSKNDKY